MKLNMNNRYSILRIFFLAITLFFGISEIKATHIVGGEITYKYLGKDTFEITLTMRRDCELGAEDAQFDDPAHISFYDGLTRRVRIDIGDLGLVRVPYSDDDTLNTFIRSECGFEGKQVCVHETKYKTKVRLPYTTRGFYVVYERCCRNSSLNNILDPLEAGSTYSVRIDRVPENQTNSSPVFSQWPDIYICKDRPLNFNHSAVDIDGDSLVYKLWNPFYGRSIESPALSQPYSRLPEFRPVQFLDGYGVNNFFGGDTLKIDSKTGVLTGTPNMVGQFLVGVEVQEYRNGKYLGSVYRDFQYNVRICAQPPVAAFDFPNDCKSLTVAFENKSTGAGRYEWNFNYPGSDSTFFSTDSSPVFTFPQAGIYQVQLTTIRGTDECRNTVIRQVPVFDIDFLADFDFVAEDCGVGDSITIRLIDKSSISDNQFSTQEVNWVVTQNGVVRNFSGNEVILKVSNNGGIQVNQHVVANNLCSSSISKTISVDDLVVIADFELTNVSCDDDETVTIALEDKSIYRGSNDFVESRTWLVTTEEGGSFTSTEKMYMVTVPRSGITIQLIASANGCADTLEQVIPASELFPKIDFKTTLDECRDSSVLIRFVPSITNMSASVSISSLVWEINGQISTDDSIMVELFGNEVVLINLKATLSNGCEINTSKAFSGTAFRPFANISVNAVECPNEDSVTYEAVYQGSLGYTGIEWLVGLASDPIALTGLRVTFTIPKDSAYFASATGIYVKGCDASATKTGISNFAKISFVANPLELCVGETAKIVANPNPGFVYVWAPTVGLDLTIPSDPIVTGIQNTTYSVTVSDGICSVEGQLQVNVSDSLRLAIAGDSIACDGSYTLHATGGKNKGQYVWSFSPGFEEIIATGDTVTINSNERISVVYVTILSDVCKVRPGSIVLKNGNPFILKDSIEVFCPGDTFTYSLTSGDGSAFSVVWEADTHIISSLNSRTIQIATSQDAASPIVLYYQASNAIGCTFRDSILITPNVRPVLDFTFTRSNCENTEACFTVIGDANVTNFTWDFGMAGNDDISSERNPCFVYPAFGTYTVTLSSSQEVCGFASVVKTINVSNQLDIIAQDDVIVCLGDTAFLRVVSSLPEMNITWLDSAGNILARGNEYNFVPVADATLFLKGIDAGGCEYTDSLNIIINKDFPTVKNGGEFTVCKGDSAILEVFIEGDLSNYEFSWDASPYIAGALDVANPTIVITADAPSDIYLSYTVINEDGCTNRGQIHLEVNSKNEIDFTFTKAECDATQVCFSIVGEFNGILTWDFGLPGNDDVSNDRNPCFVYPSQGLYSVSLRGNAAFCGFQELVKQIIVGNALDLVTQDELILCLGDTAVLQINSEVPDLSISWIDSTGAVVGQGNEYRFIPTSDVKLYVSATDISGCEFLDSVVVRLNKDFPPILNGGEFKVCIGDSAVLNVFEGDLTSYEIVWLASPYISGTLQTGSPFVNIAEDSPSDIYLAYSIVNKDGCTSPGQIHLMVNPKNVIDFTFSKPDCNGNEVCFRIIGDYTDQVTWDFGNGSVVTGTVQQCFTYADAGIYSVTAKSNTNFCGFDDISKTVIIGNQVDLIGADEVLLCSDDTATISVKSNLQGLTIVYLDEQGNVLANGPVYTFIPAADTKLILKATDLAMCEFFDTVAIKLNNNFPMLSVEGPFIVCEGDTATLPAFTQDVSGFNITWNQNQYIIGNLNVANPLVGFGGAAPGDVTLNFTVVNSDGCIQQGAAPLVIRTKPIGDFNIVVDNCEDRRVCFTTDIDERVGIKWDFGNTNAENDTSLNSSVCYSYPAADTYNVRLQTTGNFCTLPLIEKPFTLYNLDEIVTPNIANVCLRDSFQTVVLDGVPTDFNIQWFDGATQIAVGREISFQVLGSKMLTVVATDPNGCTFTDSIMLIGINEFPQLEYINIFPACLGDTVSITMINTNPNHQVTILWDEDPHFVGRRDILNPMVGIETDEMEPFYLYFTASTQFGCTLRDSIYFTPGTPNVVSIDHSAKDCDNYEVCFSIVGDYQGLVLWNFGDPNKPSGNVSGKEACFTYSGPGTYTVTITNISAFCTFKPTTKTITLRDGLVIFEDDIQTICKGESNLLTVPETVGNLRYEWFDLQGNSLGVNRPINIVGDQDKSIRVLFIDDNGCPFDDTLSLDVFDPVYTINMPEVYCQDVEAQVEVSFTGSSVEDYNFSWTPASSIVSGANTHNPIIDVTNASTLFVIIEHKTYGCLIRDTVNVVPFSFSISAQASPDTVVDLNEEVTLSVVNPQNGWTYLWSNGVTSQSQTVVAEENTTYSVTVTDANGCTAVTQVSIRVNPPDCEEDVYIPTAFSPNQDGNNDVLFVRSNYIDEMELIIFNRWGQEVFTSTSVNNGWDGTFKGKELSPDAFAYYLRAKCVDGNTITRKGNISLLR